MLKTWLVSSGDMRRARVRAYAVTEAFLIAVVLFCPKTLGHIALVVEEQFEGDDNHTYIVPTDVLTPAVQETPA